MKRQLSNAPLFAPSDALADDEAERLSTYLDALLQADLLGIPESQTIAYLARVTHEYRPEVIIACALALRAPRYGHVCLDLAQPYATLQTATEDTEPANTPETLMAVPDPADWRPLLASSPLVSTHPQATDHPFVLRENLLYTQRYFVYERELSAQLLERAARAPEPLAKTELYPTLFAGLFPSDKEEAGTTSPERRAQPRQATHGDQWWSREWAKPIPSARSSFSIWYGITSAPTTPPFRSRFLPPAVRPPPA